MKGKEKQTCKNCGMKSKEVFGSCRYCGKEVCSSCGTQQLSQVNGYFFTHNSCFHQNMDAFKTSFRFVKLTSTGHLE